jgi:large subunit ribosomal protein L17
MSRHLMRGRQLSRDTEHRLALRRNMVQSLFEHGKVKTTLPKAKEVQGFAEKLITLARTGTLNARRRVIAALNDRRITDSEQEFILNEKGNPRTVVQRLFDEVAPRYKGRPGGYTRIIKLAKWRIGDAGDIVQLELISDDQKAPTGTIRRSAGLRRKRQEKKQQFASKALKKGDKAEAKADAPAAEETKAAE